jgi:hypothetical protein
MLLGWDDKWTLSELKESALTLRFWSFFNTTQYALRDVQLILNCFLRHLTFLGVVDPVIDLIMRRIDGLVDRRAAMLYYAMMQVVPNVVDRFPDAGRALRRLSQLNVYGV